MIVSCPVQHEPDWRASVGGCASGEELRVVILDVEVQMAYEVTPLRPAAQTGASTAPTKPQAKVDPENSQSELSGERPPSAPLPGTVSETSPETQTVASTRILSAVDTYTSWNKVAESPTVSSDSERLVIMEEESPVVDDPFLSYSGATSTSVVPVTAGNNDLTNRSNPSDRLDPSDTTDSSDPSEISDPTNTRRGQAQDPKRVISS
ncbi:hypothetical protein HPB47_015634 [Ixodes persulcatus]|uniref:Uncharacterized protein n=1 Tax=Ixodes persulcatus TaxID=34615 RepID=A0AC60QVK0_IXOPE|nr:hypothetical protein HPB47_015634 [Ixodes persulcatus]